MCPICPFPVRTALCGAGFALGAAGLVSCGNSGSEFAVPPFDDIGFVGSGGRPLDGGRPVGHEAGIDGGSEGGAGLARGDAGADTDGTLNGTSDGSMAGADDGAAEGGSNVGVTLDLPPGFFVTLDWVVKGPAATYSGTVHFGMARSLEFVVGGVVSGDGYTISLTGIDAYGQFCTGTSAPFSVSAGVTTGAGVLIECFTGDAAAAADVTSGNVAVTGGVGTPDL